MPVDPLLTALLLLLPLLLLLLQTPLMKTLWTAS
jgi:hypothetical protein